MWFIIRIVVWMPFGQIDHALSVTDEEYREKDETAVDGN
jgi:hypothetical protein